MPSNYIFSFLLAGMSLLVPHFLNDFIRKMRFHHVLITFLAFSGGACAVASGDETTFVDDVGEVDEEKNGSYPSSFGGDPVEKKDQIGDEWVCGSEIITVEGPDGKLIHSEVPLPCDPIADMYTGCPSSF